MKANVMLLALTCLAVVLAGCASTIHSQTGESDAKASEVSGELVVFAAASLTDAFDALGARFQANHPDVRVRLNYAGSQQLAQQLVHGAPADLFASANETQMAAVINSGRISPERAVPFTGNHLVVVLPADNPAAITDVVDLIRPDTKLIIAAEEVPVGRYTQQFLAKTRSSPDFAPTFADDLLANVVSYEQNVRAVLSKVILGEADAGIVYSSDVASERADQVASVAIPSSVNVTANYPIAPLADSGEPELADAFIAFVQSSEGQSILADYGFLPGTDLGR